MYVSALKYASRSRVCVIGSSSRLLFIVGVRVGFAIGCVRALYGTAGVVTRLHPTLSDESLLLHMDPDECLVLLPADLDLSNPLSGPDRKDIAWYHAFASSRVVHRRHYHRHLALL